MIVTASVSHGGFVRTQEFDRLNVDHVHLTERFGAPLPIVLKVDNNVSGLLNAASSSLAKPLGFESLDEVVRITDFADVLNFVVRDDCGIIV